ncbi:MAG: sn-glycerol-1-phosphate dehydrogenase [Candidatus Dormiibacterota bacterium]
MSYEQIETALAHAGDTDEVLIGPGVVAQVGASFRRLFGDAPAVVVGDEHTYGVAGRAVEQSLAAQGQEMVDAYLFDGRPALHADYRHIETLVASLREHDAIPVAVGSGTINDIVKRSASELGRRYLNVATAASMDGYTAFGAAITREGYKQTMSCAAPRAVIADLDLLRTAPPAMTSSGYADLLGKVTAGADWIIADELGVESIDESVWSLVQGPLRRAIGRPAELHAGDPGALDELIEGLIMSGLAMQAAQSSRPASGAEHQFSHLWEMEGLGQEQEPPLSHGFKVGLGSISIAALYERLLQRDLTQIDIDEQCARWPVWADVEAEVRAAHTTPGLDAAAVRETQAKYADRAQLRERLTLVCERWPHLSERLRQQLLSADELRRMLRAAGCPTSPAEIGLELPAFRETYRRARMIRRRYTVLDLVYEAGILDECVDELFDPGGFWAPAAAVRRSP